MQYRPGKNNGRKNPITARQILVKGLVQGVGFRPFVLRLANKYNLTGWVKNTNESVHINIQGTEYNCDCFVQDLVHEKPRPAEIRHVKNQTTALKNHSFFSILKSQDVSEGVTRVSPDIAVCDECLQDMANTENRQDHPLINCTHCGPRFSIVKELPYDRGNTTMSAFEFCPDCEKEYNNPADRRFHAQPVSCNRCGPQYQYINDNEEIYDIAQLLKQATADIDKGGVIAIKGMGGFHLMCNALDEMAVHQLREIKKRDWKPFAVLFRNIEEARHYAYIDNEEVKALEHWRRPIVLVKQKKPLANGVNPSFNTLGMMLPYMPMHYLLFQRLNTPALVLTSGNYSDEPIAIDNDEAVRKFLGMTQGLLLYNREIHNRTDDSVVMVANKKPRVLRRSRGYVPQPVEVSADVNNILATGAELVNTFSLGKGRQAIMSQHIGDLKDYDTYTFFEETINKFQRLFRVKPEMIVHDLHPDYLSTRYALDKGLPSLEVQHHHAHIASCMAEHDLQEPVIGVCFDGTGLGDDGHLWGGEFMVANYEAYTRFAHLNYMTLPGGEASIKAPWRTALAYLHKLAGPRCVSMDIPLLKQVSQPDTATVIQSIEKNINCPMSSGMGRLFDVVAALTGLCVESHFHAEAPMKLESIIDDTLSGEYPWHMDPIIHTDELIKEILSDIQQKVPIPVIATRFHNSVVSMVVYGASRMMKVFNTSKVVLTGGVFQNKYLLEKTEERLSAMADVYSHHNIPANDGGISLGQLLIAAHKRTNHGITKIVKN
ncbi:MAG: carbamoyltransferase HypF [Bacteroidota bacterium]